MLVVENAGNEVVVESACYAPTIQKSHRSTYDALMDPRAISGRRRKRRLSGTMLGLIGVQHRFPGPLPLPADPGAPQSRTLAADGDGSRPNAWEANRSKWIVLCRRGLT
jgi:hypothetical protein